MLTLFGSECAHVYMCLGKIGVREVGLEAGRIVGWLTLVLSRRRMNWKFVFSPETSDIVAVDGRCSWIGADRSL